MLMYEPYEKNENELNSIQRNLSNENQLKLNNWNLVENQNAEHNAMVISEDPVWIKDLNIAWMNQKYLLESLKDCIDNAVMCNPKTWDLIPDARAKVQALNMAFKLRRDYNSNPVINIINAFAKSDKIY